MQHIHSPSYCVRKPQNRALRHSAALMISRFYSGAHQKNPPPTLPAGSKNECVSTMVESKCNKITVIFGMFRLHTVLLESTLQQICSHVCNVSASFTASVKSKLQKASNAYFSALQSHAEAPHHSQRHLNRIHISVLISPSTVPPENCSLGVLLETGPNVTKHTHTKTKKVTFN